MAFRLNKAKIRQGVYILCCSEAEAKNLLSELEKIGYSWNGNDGTPMSETFWSEVRYGKIAYYIRDDQRKKLQYRAYDFDDVENRMVSYADVMLEEQFIRFYSKVVTLAEDLLSDGEGDSGTDRLMMAMAMSSMTGDGRGQDGQMLLPLLLLKDKGDGDEKKTDRLTKLMLISSMCGNGGDQNAMLPLLLLKGDLF